MLKTGRDEKGRRIPSYFKHVYAIICSVATLRSPTYDLLASSYRPDHHQSNDWSTTRQCHAYMSQVNALPTASQRHSFIYNTQS